MELVRAAELRGGYCAELDVCVLKLLPHRLGLTQLAVSTKELAELKDVSKMYI